MVFFIILGGFVCTVFNAYLYYNYIVDSYEFIFKFSNLSQDIINDRYKDLYHFGIILILATLMIILIIAAWGLLITHRAADSVYHIKRVIEEIKAGNTQERIRLRKKDEFHEVADAFNQLLDELNKP